MTDTFVNYIGHNKTVMFQTYDTDQEGIDLLLKLMDTEPLEPRLEETLGYTPQWLEPASDHARERKGVKSYLGNFHRISCVFNIDTSDPDVIARLDAAIAKNLASSEYQAAKAEVRECQTRRQEERRARQSSGRSF
jgi:hypothetical protein